MGTFLRAVVTDAAGKPLANASGKIYDINDTGNVSPLALTTLAGQAIALDTITSNDDGVTPDFKVVGKKFVKWVSGAYEVGMVAADQVPPGGTPGQVLTKDGDFDYELKWANPLGIASGGIDGQVLIKDGSDPYATRWGNPTSGTSSSTGTTDYFVPGSVAYSRQDDLGNWPQRPTDRDDVMVLWVGVDSWPAIVPNGVNGPHVGDLFIEKRVV